MKGKFYCKLRVKYHKALTSLFPDDCIILISSNIDSLHAFENTSRKPAIFGKKAGPAQTATRPSIISDERLGRFCNRDQYDILLNTTAVKKVETYVAIQFQVL
jgi:hypothetical protein